MGFNPYRTKAIDLFLADEFDNITHVFEIKAEQNSTSLYQAIGQAMWHGASEVGCPKRIIVLPGKLAPSAEERMKRLAIEVLRYDWAASKPVFLELSAVVTAAVDCDLN